MKCVVHAAIGCLAWCGSALGLFDHYFGFNFLIILDELIIILNLDIIALRFLLSFGLLILHEIVV